MVLRDSDCWPQSKVEGVTEPSSEAPDSDGSYDVSGDSESCKIAVLRKDRFLPRSISGAASEVTLRACFLLVGGRASATSVRDMLECLVSILSCWACVLCSLGISSALDEVNSD